jgi:hypothetical protein
MHRRIALWGGLALLLASGSTQAAPAVEGAGADDPLARALGQVRGTAGHAAGALRVAVSRSLEELRDSAARAARSSMTPYGAVEGRAPTAEQIAFRLTQQGPFDEAIASESERWGLDPFLLKGLLLNESELNPKTIGKKAFAVVRGKRRVVSGGSVGIAQFSASGIRGVTELRRQRAQWGEKVDVFTYEKALDPSKAIPAAAEVLSSYIGSYGRDGGVTAYNTGLGGGQMVRRYGFWRARAMGKLRRHGHVRLQGDRFLLNVLRRTNRLRTGAGLPPLPPPDHDIKRAPRPSRPKTPLATS